MTSPLPYPCARHKAAFVHFSKRWHSRVSETDDTLLHWWRIVAAVEKADGETVEFCGRLVDKSRRLWRYHIQDAPPVFIVFDHGAMCPITVLRRNLPVRCGSKGQRVIIDGEAYAV